MKKLVILGGAGIGMIAAAIARELESYEILGFLNDSLPIGSQIGKFIKFPVIGTSKDIVKYLDADCDFFIAYVGLGNEAETFKKIEGLGIPDERLATLIHPTAIIPRSMCSIGAGVLMAPLAQLSPDITLENNVILLANSFVGHDTLLKKFAHVATNGVVGANVSLGRGVHVGSNATIREKVVVGDFSLIGAGSVILNDIDSNSVWVGNPARKLR
jgi:acetyltransferase EpsM